MKEKIMKHILLVVLTMVCLTGLLFAQPLPPHNLRATVVAGPNVNLAWEIPRVHLSHSIGFSNGIGVTGPNTYSLAQRFSAEQRAAAGIYEDLRMLSISFGVYLRATDIGPVSLSVVPKIWTSAPNAMTATVAYTHSTPRVVNTLAESEVWITVQLDTPWTIPATGDVWIGYTMTTTAPATLQTFPWACDSASGTPRLHNMAISGQGATGTWSALQDLNASLVYNWVIRGNAGYPGTTLAPTVVLGDPVEETYHPNTNTNHQLSSIAVTPEAQARFLALNPNNRSPLEGYVVSHGEVGTAFPGNILSGTVGSPHTTLTYIHAGAPNNTFQTYWVTSVVEGYESAPASASAIIGTPTITIYPHYQDFEVLTSLPVLWSRSGSPNWRVWPNPVEAYSGAAYALSIAQTGTTANSRLITPRFAVPNAGAGNQFMLIFQARGIEATNATYSVELSTTGTAPANFTNILVNGETVFGADGWQEIQVDLTEFAGENVYIAIRHHQTGPSFFAVDDVWVGVVPATNLTFPPVTGTITDDSFVTTVVLEWDPIGSPTSNLVGYNVYREGKLQAYVDKDSPTTFTQNYPINGNHEYSVRAVYRNPGGLSTPLTAIVSITEGETITSRPSNPGLSINDGIEPGTYMTTINWEPPIMEYVQISQGGDNDGNGVGWLSFPGLTREYHFAHRYSVAQLAALGVTGGYLDRVSFIPYPDTTMASIDYKITIFTNGEEQEDEDGFYYEPGTIRHTQLVPTFALEAFEWNDIDLLSPVFLNPNQELLIAISAFVTYRRPTGNRLMQAVDNGPRIENFGFLTSNAGLFEDEWWNVVPATLNYNWCIRASVIATGGANASSAPIVLGTVSNPQISNFNRPRELDFTVTDRGSISTLSENIISRPHIPTPRPTLRNTRADLTGYVVYACIVGEEPVCLTEEPTSNTFVTFGTEPGSWEVKIYAVYGSGPDEVRSEPTIVDFFVGPFEIRVYPYELDFSSVQFPPPGWKIVDADGDGRSWTRVTSGGNSFISSQARSGGATSNWLISPKIFMPAQVMPNFQFYYNIRKDAPGNERITFHVSTTGNDIEDFTFIANSTVQQENSFAEFGRALMSYAGQEIYFAVQHSTTGASNGYVHIDRIEIRGTIDEIDELRPMVTELVGNYPNPFNPETIIKYSVATDGPVTIEVFNIKGQKVTTLLNDVVEAGAHEVHWNGLDSAGRNVSSGVYFYRMQTNDAVSTRKMVLLK
jgi:hypothetical protein